MKKNRTVIIVKKMNFLIRRVQNYLNANGLNIYDEDSSDYFRFNDFTNEFDLWTPVIERPDMVQLILDYPDSVIEKEIALRQLRAYRNTILRDTDKFVVPDFPLTEQVKNELIAWRQLIRDLPTSINQNLLMLNQYGRMSLDGIFPALPISGAFGSVKKKYSFLS